MSEQGLTWAQIAEKLHVSTAAMAQWKTGKTSPSRRTIFLLEQAERAAGIAPPAPPLAPAPPPSPAAAQAQPAERKESQSASLADVRAAVREEMKVIRAELLEEMARLLERGGTGKGERK